jgi:uncharacterized protein YggE
MKAVRIGVVVALLGVAAAFAGVGLPEGAHGSAEPIDHTITVNGVGKSSTVPDRATFTFGVTTDRKTASEASEANNRDMRSLIDGLHGAGVPGEAIQTSQISLYPDYSDSGDVRGYEASNSVTVTVSLAKAGDALQAAVSAGANQVDGPTLTKEDARKLYDAALRDAVADARSRAEVLAEAAGVKVGEVVSIQETTDSSGPIPLDMRSAAAPTSAPIEAGTQDVEADVTVTFAIA